MRQIVLDTETTGLDWRSGDRVLEIGCVEMLNRNLTGRHFHVYINPGRSISAEAIAVHGITEDFLADKPKFQDIADDFIAFVRDAELVIHNAGFDVGFLDNELSLSGKSSIKKLCGNVIDTLKLAKEQNPGKKASLDALCERYEVENAHRTLHGALLDAELLADVYLAMTRGQESLIIALDEPPPGAAENTLGAIERRRMKVVRASEPELLEHQKTLDDITRASGGMCLWKMPGAEHKA